MKHILLIEDDLAIAELERDYLEADGFEITIETDGQKGLKSALTENYDLLLVDVMLPGKDGFQIVREVRKKKDIPILMISAKREDIDKIRGLGLRADDYISKPFSPSELVARVKAHSARYERLIAKADKSLAAFIEVGSLEIQPEGHRVFIRGKEISLTHKEFELLLFLARNRGIVFSKDVLFERVWGLDAVGDTATVMVHVNRLREKLEKDPSKPEFIETVWGVGYRLK